MSYALPVFIAIALVATIGAGVVLHGAETDASALRTVEGRVMSVEWNPNWNVSVEFTLETSGANQTMHHIELGPPWWWAEHDAPSIRVNDTVKVQGELEGDSIEAFTIWVNGGPAIVLRDRGMPAWASERSGGTSGASETEDSGDLE